MARRDRMRWLGRPGGLGLALAAGLALGANALADARKVTGTVEISQIQVAFLYSGNIGGGTLTYQGKQYPFTIGGLGIGGIGASRIEATGEVYNLERLEDFSGAYVQARYGLAAGTKSAGELWLENASGVGLRLDARREGLALSLGGDAIYIAFD
ncbi:MAG: hypothetical protein RQ752_05300 [Thermohalobaculum sp.]|nr:hypothetical protein [Thermohalobaculum sp.]